MNRGQRRTAEQIEQLKQLLADQQQARDTIDLSVHLHNTFFLFDWRSTKFKTFVVCVGRFNQVNLTILDEIY